MTTATETTTHGGNGRGLALLEYPNWVAWREDPPDKPGDKLKKVPINPHTGNLGSSTDPASWGTLVQAKARAARDDLAGMGFVFTDSPFAGVDLDHCRDAATGAIEPWALEIIRELDSYSEVSPSGTGVHVFVKGDKPGGSCKLKRDGGGEIEIYDSGRYFTFTGDHLEGTPRTVEARPAELAALYWRLFPKPAETARPGPMPSTVGVDDQELIAKMTASKNGADIQALFDGDTSAHNGDDSGADQALCNHLAFWTGRDPVRMDRLFRTSGLMRDKWDSKRGATTYGWITIDTAIRDTQEVWTPGNGRAARQVDDQARGATVVDTAKPAQQTASPYTLAETIAVFKNYLYMPDPGPLCFDLGVVVANHFPGDAVWGLKVGAPGFGKTETLNGISGLQSVKAISTLTVPGLLSGTSKREKHKDARGGLLLEIGNFGIIALKDFGSILSMNRDARAELLAALREIYDGSLTRYVGSDGGRCLHWAGKVGIVGCTTPAIDHAHAVMQTLGERFVLYRMPEEGRGKRAQMALGRGKDEATMRAHIADAVTGLFASISIPDDFPAFTDQETKSLIALADLTATCRSAVIRDPYRREIELIPGAEVPTRLVVCLGKLYRAFMLIGMSQQEAWGLIKKVALDSMPQIRRNLLEILLQHDAGLETKLAAVAAGYPTETTRHALQDLACYNVLQRDPTGRADVWLLTDWTRKTWADAVFYEKSEDVTSVGE